MCLSDRRRVARGGGGGSQIGRGRRKKKEQTKNTFETRIKSIENGTANRLLSLMSGEPEFRRGFRGENGNTNL